VNKVIDGGFDAAILAFAGLHRLNLDERIYAILPPSDFIPAPGQGALAVQIRKSDNELYNLVSQLDDRNTRIAVETERDILAAMQGGCSIPLGVNAQINGQTITINAVISDLEARKYIKLSKTGPISEAVALAKIVVDELFKNGAKEILEQIKSAK
jgi:hydroxymethylbilane synthase